MNKPTLSELGIEFGTDKATYHNFTDFYEKELEGMEIKTILEIGILNGSSLRMWKAFYPDAIVIGLDVQEPLDIPNVICLKGDASDPMFLMERFKDIKFDLIIDDGSHKTQDQITAFNNLFDAVKSGGIYICEDVHTSFREDYINSKKTFVEYIDSLGMKNTIERTTYWWKNPNDKTDSGTCIIRKR